jgi:hypothetical protein
MRNQMSALIIAVGLVGGGIQARAADGGFFLEPGVTYEAGDMRIDYPILSDSTGTNKGLGVMARLGLHASETIFLGADLRYAQTRVTDSAFNTEAEATGYNYGAMIGLQMPVVGLRLLAGYVLGGELDPKSDKGVDVKYKDPKGYRVGAGMHVLAISLNLEYQDLKYEKSDIVGIANNTDSVQAYNKAWILSATFPMEF